MSKSEIKEREIKIRKILDGLKNNPEYRKLNHDLLFADLVGIPFDAFQIKERIKKILEQDNIKEQKC